MEDLTSKITLNNEEYYFASTVISSEIVGTNSTQIVPTNIKTDATKINFNAFESISLVDNVFAPFDRLNFTLNTPSSLNIENQNNFALKGNNRNLVGLALVRAKEHRGCPENLTGLSPAERATILNFNGILASHASLGSLKGSYSLHEYVCDDNILCFLKEKKISQILPAVDNSITVGDNIIAILQTVLSDTNIDRASFAKCTERFTSPFIYPAEFTAYDALNFLLPFCLGNVDGLDVQLFLKYSKVTQKYYLTSPVEILAGMNFAEKFYIGEQTSEDEKPASIFKTQNSIYTAGNDIINYIYTEPSFNKSNENYVNIKVSNSTNPAVVGDMGFISLPTEIENFSRILKQLQTKYISGVKLNIPLDPSKIGDAAAANYRVFRAPYNRDVLERMAKAQLYSLFMFENMSLSFTVPGQVYRESGTFVEIDRKTFGGKFDKKLLGHWFITEVKHLINSKGTYMNQLICTKPFVVN